MTIRPTWTAALLSFFVTQSRAQNITPREVRAVRTTATIKIDGVTDEPAWKEAAAVLDYTEFRPTAFKKEDPATRTEAYILYNDIGIYVGGYIHERSRDSIAAELKGRDGFGNNDYVGIIFDTYKDHINGFEYFVTPLGEQWDAKMAPNPNGNNEDFTWDAVWESSTVIHSDGWSFEMFIPFSAIRFSKKNLQDWGMNITRRRRKTEQQVTWNPIDVNVNGFLTQEGYLTGLENIKPPLRLQFSPYFSVYANHYPLNQPGQTNWTSKINGGMDVKYGINQAMTLDMTLIPDFGQVQSDNQVLNLSPFEVQYNENRTFFKEGTELFSKGGLFYSRRIGGSPIHAYDLSIGPNQEILKNPTESKLINATKISGRTHSGLGIGILNAVTNPQYATVEDRVSKEQVKMQTDPLTNYNVFVLDQTLRHNSSISFVNTNVWRSGKDYDANVSAALFDLNDKKNTWNAGGKLANSNLFGAGENGKNISGYSGNTYFGKTSGRWVFNIYQEFADTKYTHNDLGYFTNNNYISRSLWSQYKWTKPKGIYNQLIINLNLFNSSLFSRIPGIDTKYQSVNFNVNANMQSKKLFWVGFFAGANLRQNDFYEPRTSGWYFKRGASFIVDAWFESNSNKKYSFYTEIANRRTINFYNGDFWDINFQQNYRVSKRLSFSLFTGYYPRMNNMGYAANGGTNTIIFGKRDINTVENIFNSKYSFNNKMWLTLRVRHYWSKVEYKAYYNLQNDGTLSPAVSFTGNTNDNVNFFNVDMVYTWQFAPGSFLNLVWKNAIFSEDNDMAPGYFKNLGNTVATNQNNNFSLKVIYFLDYLKLKKNKH